jgi:hypothetical protein
MWTRPTPSADSMPEPGTAAMRARRYLLIPVIPILVLSGLLLSVIVLSLFPNWINRLVLPIAYAGSLFHAARRAKAGWVVAIAVFFPSLVAYWIYTGLRLDRT